MCLVPAGLIAADATGKWTGTLTEVSSGGDDRPGPALLVLKQDGTKLTGTAGPGEDSQRPIQNGKSENGKLTFEIVRDAGGTMKFSLQQEGDEIRGDVRGDQGGKAQVGKLAVKRSK